jgi:soluble lytic murein transglycosylase-like protein
LSPYWPDNISQWSELIIRYADLREIPADLLAAQMYQESGGDPDATGAAGEIGLMQILGRYHPCASYDPEQNISCGTAILAGHYKATGDWNTALARYNAGTAGQSMGNGYVYADKIISMYEEAESER